jgi:EmrB/QacA subfamily drug resistance transporter
MDLLKEKRIILIVASLAAFLVPYTVSSMAVALPAIGSRFGLDAVMLGWVMSAYMFTAAICIVPLGRVADIFGRKRLFLLGTMLFTTGAFLAAVSVSGDMLIASRVIQGLGGAMIFATSVAIVTAVFPPGERGRALGINVAAVYAGLSVGPFLGGVLTQHLGWPSIFLVNVPVGIAVIILTRMGVSGEWAESRGQQFDLIGSLFYGLMIIGGMYGLTLLPATIGIFWILGGMVMLAGFLWWEKKSASPLIEIPLFRSNPSFLFSNLAAMINYSAIFAVAFLMSLYLQYIKGLDPQTTGLILVAQPVVQMIVSPVSGHFSDTIEPKIMATAGMGVTAVGIGLLTFLSEQTSPVYIVVSMIILGLGYGIFSSPNTNAIMSAVKAQHLGIASGMVATMRAIGQMLSLSIAMVTFSLLMGNVQITPQYYPQLMQSVNMAFLIFLVLCFAGIWASYCRGTIRGKLIDH